MLDVPSHLLQPLCIDTNITYDLDMSKFPGLDDPQQMHQPALLIATDWSDYVYHDAECVTDASEMSDNSYDSDDLSVDDLYFLIESSQEFFMNVNSSDKMNDQIFQSLVDDVVSDSDVILDTDPATPNDITEPLHDTWDGLGDVPFYREDIEKLTSADRDIITREQLPPLVSCTRGHKRRRNNEIESGAVNKKSKTAEISCLQIPTMVSVCSRSNVCEHVRHS